MGLAEKRSAKEFEDGKYQEYASKVKEILGKDVDIEVSWDQLAVEGHGNNYADFFSKVYFEPLVSSLDSICADDMGKEAVAESLEKIVVKNEADCSNADKWCAFDGKVITLDHAADRNIDNIDARTTALTTTIESAL